MRIIAGSLCGREIWTPQTSGTRPAMGKTREALFSMLDARGVGWNQISVLDLFAGTGSLAFEALSRGAADATFVDNSSLLVKTMLRNIEALGVADRCHVYNQDALRFLSRTPDRRFQLVFVDPPYRRNYAQPCLTRLATRGWLAPDAFIVGELENGLEIIPPAGFESIAKRLFGQTLLHIWKFNENSPLSGDI